MELLITRDYFPEGVNGRLYAQNDLICYTIELPWRNNAKQISCIPEGRYLLIRCYSKKFGWHLEVKNVPDRSEILIHAVNIALSELKGCIGAVQTLTGKGTGNNSRKALKTLVERTRLALENELIYLTIKKAI